VVAFSCLIQRHIGLIQGLRNAGIQETRNPGIEEFKNAKVQEFRNLGMQEFSNSGAPGESRDRREAQEDLRRARGPRQLFRSALGALFFHPGFRLEFLELPPQRISLEILLKTLRQDKCLIQGFGGLPEDLPERFLGVLLENPRPSRNEPWESFKQLD
jgi:hypothetical protein